MNQVRLPSSKVCRQFDSVAYKSHIHVQLLTCYFTFFLDCPQYILLIRRNAWYVKPLFLKLKRCFKCVTYVNTFPRFMIKISPRLLTRRVEKWPKREQRQIINWWPINQNLQIICWTGCVRSKKGFQLNTLWNFQLRQQRRWESEIQYCMPYLL